MPLSQSQLDTITRTVLGEAANQGTSGMEAVAAVINNRAQSGQFGSSDPAVIAASHQFSANLPVSRGGNLQGRNASPNSAIYQQAQQAVLNVLNGTVPDPTGGATYYHVTGTSAPGQANMIQTAQIGAHTFYSPPGSAPAASTAEAYASPTEPTSPALSAIQGAMTQTPAPEQASNNLNATFGAGSLSPSGGGLASLSPDIPAQTIMGNDITPSGSAVPLAASRSGGGLANLPSQSTAAPIPMDRLRVAPSDILSAVKQFASGSNVNLNAVSPDQQQALVSALPTLMAFPDGTDGQVAALKYLQANNLLDPLLAVVPTQDVNPFMRGMGQMKYGVPIPPTIPTDPSQWGLPGNPSQLPTEIAALTNPDQYRRPISPTDGSTANEAPQGLAALPSGGWNQWGTPAQQAPVPLAPKQPIGIDAGLSSNIGAGAGVTGQDSITPNMNSPVYMPPAMDAYSTPQADGSYSIPSLDNPMGTSSTNRSGGIGTGSDAQSYYNGQNAMPAADLSSLGVDPSVSVPQYTTISKRVQVPSSQPIEQGSGVHWDDATGQYVLDSPTPAKPTYKTVQQRVINPAWKAPTGLAALPSPQGPLARINQPGGIFGAISSPDTFKSLGASIGQMTPQQQANYNPQSVAALNNGQAMYTPSGGNMGVPTTTIGGGLRNTYADTGNPASSGPGTSAGDPGGGGGSGQKLAYDPTSTIAYFKNNPNAGVGDIPAWLAGLRQNGIITSNDITSAYNQARGMT